MLSELTGGSEREGFLEEVILGLRLGVLITYLVYTLSLPSESRHWGAFPNFDFGFFFRLNLTLICLDLMV